VKSSALDCRNRNSTPYVGLISPHHDIYSIEDLSQFCFDKKCNREAKLSSVVSEGGYHSSRSCKAKADVILISGYDGGTGAAPLTSTTYRYSLGTWLLAQQTLILNDLRVDVVLECDGQLKQEGR
jgi:glutamate synthase (ferredoxin)